MFTSPIVLQKNGAGTEFSYGLSGTQESASTYRDPTADIAQPRTLKIAHQRSNVGKPTQTRRSVVRIDHAVTIDGQPYPGISAYVVLVVPEMAVTTAQVQEALGELSDFLVQTGFQDKVINQEI